MDLQEWFRSRQTKDRRAQPDEIRIRQKIKAAWTECTQCKTVLSTGDLLANNWSCHRCFYHFATEEVKHLLDEY